MMKKIPLFVLCCLLTLIQLKGQDVKKDSLEDTLLKYFAQNLKYVDESKVGLSILEWKVKNGEIYDDRIINPLSNKIEKEIKRVLYLTEGKWNITNEQVAFYLPVKFKMNGHNFFSRELPASLNGIVLSEVTVVRYGNKKTFKSDQILIKKLNEKLQKTKFKKCIRITEELLRRNPFSFQIREIRIRCLNEIGDFQDACDDIEFIEKYLSQKSKSSCEIK